MATIKGHTIITISRTFGSGGREVAQTLATDLGIPFYDKELLEIAARKHGLSSKYLERFDEKRNDNFLYSMALNPQSLLTGWGYGTEPIELVVQKLQYETIRAVASEGSCIIVGRRADQILKGEMDTFRVFISAALDKRIERVSSRDHLSRHDSEQKIKRMDKSRKSYYNSFGEGDWADASNYDLCVDSGALGVKNAAELLKAYMRLNGKLSD